MHLHFLYVPAFTQRCSIFYVAGGSLTLRYKDKENLFINGGLCGVELCPALWPVRTDMEMYVVRRPVKGGPAQMPPA